MRSTLRIIELAAGLLLLCGPGAASAQDRLKEMSGSPDNPLTPVEGPFAFSSEEGDFQVTWPGGCNGLRTRTPVPEGESDGEGDRERPVITYCDRNGEKGEGCSVTAIFNARDKDGAGAGPQEVVARLQAMLKSLGAEVKRQSPLTKDFPDGRRIEGIDVQAAQTGGSGQVWLRGLLYDGTIYILAAWDLGGYVWENPEYGAFFASFEPGAR